MNDVIKMAEEAGFDEDDLTIIGRDLLKFAALIRADMKEQCAKVCEGLNAKTFSEWPDECAAAIRAMEDK